MSHDHSHRANYDKAFGFGMALNVIYIIVEVFYGLRIDSTALLADAGHNISDVLSLLISWVAIKLAAKPTSAKFTYGYRKATIFASILNALLIFGAVILIGREAAIKLTRPTEVPGIPVMIVAGIGIFINALTAFFFYRGRKKDLNIKGAFLHMAADAAVSLGVVLGGFLILRTNEYLIDPILSFIIIIVIIYNTWDLLKDAVNLALDGVPKNIDTNEVQKFLEHVDGVEEVHDLHIWAISTTETVLTAHLVVPGGHSDEFIFDVREKLNEEFGIVHVTLQLEHTYQDELYRKERF